MGDCVDADMPRYFTTQDILVYEKTLKRGFLGQLLRNPNYVQTDMDIYEYFKAQGAKIESPPELFTSDYGCYLYQGREINKEFSNIKITDVDMIVKQKRSYNRNPRKCGLRIPGGFLLGG